jgi:hypothetical protein
MAGTRPVGVTVIAVITWINGAIGIANGVIGLLGGGGTAAWISLALGVLVLAVGVGLLNGKPIARILATIVFALTVAAAVYSLFNGGTLWSAIGTGGLSLLALILLYTARSNSFFK